MTAREMRVLANSPKQGACHFQQLPCYNIRVKIKDEKQCLCPNNYKLMEEEDMMTKLSDRRSIMGSLCL